MNMKKPLRSGFFCISCMTLVEGKRWMRCAYPPYNALFQLVGRVSAAHPPLAARNRRCRAGKRRAPAISSVKQENQGG
ncbi:hypothetical protein FZI39_12185 [Cronobacter sakazakii]|nr:hypothetical protein FZI39_12185 [Cronobacter sakazakii]KAB1012177.1 hypothetical protein FZI53_01635 [Cronobacter sakazakii]KAB1022111.1 hypothetical protein FZI43_08775 [Cronobacter sakazakii]